ncbi:MAG: KH domain-containing protein [Bacteroidetes bacterium]|nr:KH domain-containing protein [Bacteroidota bacterium]
MKDIVEAIVKNIVQQPDAIKITIEEVENRMTLKISVVQTDLGRLIGKEGRNINAIRTLASAIGAKDNKRVKVEILEG